MRHASTGATAAELNGLVAPSIDFYCTGRTDHPNRLPRIVSPEGAVATANRAVAVGQLSRLSGNLKPNRTAVA
jgi:hypothetical protein